MKRRARIARAAACAVLLGACAVQDAAAYSLWSTNDAREGTGELHLPRESAKLGELRVRNLLLVGPAAWVIPFNNDGAASSTACAAAEVPADSQALRINENVVSCPAVLRDGEFSILVVDGGRHQGNGVATLGPGGEIAISADVVLRFAGQPAVRASFYATSGETDVPPQLHAQADEVARRVPWMAAGRGKLRGRLGDFDDNGWVDGTIIAIGTLPGGAGGSAAKQYLLIRHFETDLPVAGVLSGNVKALVGASMRR